MRKQRTYWWGIITMLLTYLYTPILLAQAPGLEWDKTLGGNIWEELNSMIVLDDGGYLLGGYTSSNQSADVSQNSQGGGDYWIVKLDASGEKEWDKRFGGATEDRLWSIKATQDGGFILGGNSNSPVGGDKSQPVRGEIDLWIIRLDSQGTIIWERTLGSTLSEDLVAGLLPTPDGGFILGAHSNSDAGFEKTEDSRGGYDFWLVKLDANGQILWDKTVGGALDDMAFSIALAPEGFVIGGLSWSNSGGEKTEDSRGITDYWLVKMDHSGNIIWDKTYGGVTVETLVTILPVSNGGYLLGGSSDSAISGEKTEGSYGGVDFWLIKIDEEGTVEWDRTFGGTELDVLHAIQEAPTGDFVFGGVSASSQSGNHSSASQGAYDYWFISTNKSGLMHWEKSLGGSDNDALTCIIPASNGGFLLGGHSSSNASGDKSEDSKGMNDMWVAKTICQLEIDLGSDFSVCENEPFSLDSRLTDCPNCTFGWEDGSTDPFRVDRIAQPSTFYLDVTSPYNCATQDSITIDVLSGMSNITFTVEEIGCDSIDRAAIIIENIEGGLAPYTIFYDEQQQTELFIENVNAGMHTLHLEDAQGCTFDTLLNVEMAPLLSLDLGEDITIQSGESAQLEAITNQEAIRMVWTNSGLLSCMNCLDPEARPTETTEFQLRVYNDAGCMASDAVTVFVEAQGQVYIPNAFSPNRDGWNDEFMIYGDATVNQIKTFRIFDKWGSILLDESAISPNEAAWDGRFRGQEMPIGVYAYFVIIEFSNGSEELFSGDLMLLR